VSALHIPSFDHSSLISGGGDPVLKIWDWMTGVVKHEVSVLEIVEPFIAVRALKRKRGQAEDDGDEAPKGSKGKAKRKQGKKGNQAEERATDGSDAATLVMDLKDEDFGDSSEEKPQKVLVINKVDSVNSDTGPYIVFSAVG
jgi:tRNA (guanine-N(7)-)-methyltransferase subunit TRM82